MANKYRGEVDAVLDGKQYRLVLTLNALAELESAFEEDDMVALAQRFDSGRLKAVDCVRILAAGLRGAGYDISNVEVGNMQTSDGAAGFVSIVARLLDATFGGGDTAVVSGGEVKLNGTEPGPFPGAT